MDTDALLAAFDHQIRRAQDNPSDLERDGHILRIVPPGIGWAGVIWSDLDTDTADAVIARQIERFGDRSWEWKHYSHDRPADLPERLIAAGFAPEDPEALLVAEIADLALDAPTPAGIRLVPVTDVETIHAVVRVHDEVFGGDYAALGLSLRRRLAQAPDRIPAVVAMAGDVPVSSGRIEFHDGTDFASLWGGGTMPEWRGRGVFRAIVAYRAALAAAAGFRYLQVDASDDSRPILRRLGFAHLATTTPYVR
jgi:ribosomal protein S18 acetylase RimI-like enzyme